MSGLLLNFRNTMIVSAILALIMIIGFGVHAPGGFDAIFWQAVLRWVHVAAGILWIGLLYYFNFVQIRKMPEIPDLGILWIGLLYYFNFVQIRKMPEIPAELKPAVSKYIAPEALFWFRWAALVTVLAGLAIAGIRGYTLQALTLGFAGNAPGAGMDVHYTLLGTGMWLALIMFFNVWGVIWPNQKIALGIVEADAEAKAKAAKIATLFSRTNTLLSLPMLVAMTMSQTIFG